jgi:hypothetical protein
MGTSCSGVGRGPAAGTCSGSRVEGAHHSPRRPRRRLEAKIKHLRTTKQSGPVQVAGRLGMNPSIVGRVIARLELPKLVAIDRATGLPIRREPVVRSEHPGRCRQSGPPGSRSPTQGPRSAEPGYSYIHTAIDDHTRLAYWESIPTSKEPPRLGSGIVPSLVRHDGHPHRLRAHRQWCPLPLPHLGHRHGADGLSHSSLAGHPPISHVTNLPGQYI